MAVFVGIILGVLASMCGTAGKQLFRFSELQRRKDTPAAVFMAKVTMIVALVLNTVAGPLIDMASYAFASQSLIAPLGALDVVWNTISAPCTLGETLSPMLVLGCALIFGGAVTTSLVGSHEEDAYTVEEMQEMLVHWRVLVYLIILFSWLAFNIRVLQRGMGDRIRGLSLGMTAGSIAGNMFCVKAFVEIVQGSIVHQTGEYFLHWLPYVVLVGAVFFAVSNLVFLTKAMREYEAVFMGAVFEGSLIFAASVSGCVVFKELGQMEAHQIIIYWAALALIIVGIGVVAEGAKRKQLAAEEKEAESGDLEEQNAAAQVVERVKSPESGPATDLSFSKWPDHSFSKQSSFGHIPSLLAVENSFIPGRAISTISVDHKSDCGSYDGSVGGSMSAFSGRSRKFTGQGQPWDHLVTMWGASGGSGRNVAEERPTTILEGDDEDAPSMHPAARDPVRRSIDDKSGGGAYLDHQAQHQLGLFRNIVLEPGILRIVAACVGATGMGRLAATSRLGVDSLVPTLQEERGLPGRWTYIDNGSSLTYCIRSLEPGAVGTASTRLSTPKYRFEEKHRDGSIVQGILTQDGDWAIGRLDKGAITHGFIRVRATGDYTVVSQFMKVESRSWGRETTANRANYEAKPVDDCASHASLPSRVSSLEAAREFGRRRGSEPCCPVAASLLARTGVTRQGHCGTECSVGACMSWLRGGEAAPPCGRPRVSRSLPPQGLGRERRYLVDNSRLRADTMGLALRTSKNLQDTEWRIAQSARWGEVVVGREEDDWLRVGDHYLPLTVEGVRVVVPVSAEEILSQAAGSGAGPSPSPSPGGRATRGSALSGKDAEPQGSPAPSDKQVALTCVATVQGNPQEAAGRPGSSSGRE